MAGAWLLTAGAALGVTVRVEPAWGRLLCLIIAATALRIALRTIWRSARSTRRVGPSAGTGQGRRAVVHLRGEITAGTAHRAGRRLSAALATGPPVLEIDLARVTLLTRDGTQIFFDAVRTAHAAGIPVVISNARPQARATLHTLGLDRVLHYTNDT
ncbi:STAS domain-containing protein [Streptomyces sp. NPDC058256]|uniref:STAS domain-containing protein n=1 Tax=Streptomyces sp. NPDC058256 TaxID=3346408 RepID=UPI0036EC9971